MAKPAASGAFQSYLDNAEKSSGKTIAQMHAALKKSGLDKHGEMRAFLMENFRLGHGHANAVVVNYLTPDFKGSTKPAAKKAMPAKKTVAKKPATKK